MKRLNDEKRWNMQSSYYRICYTTRTIHFMVRRAAILQMMLTNFTRHKNRVRVTIINDVAIWAFKQQNVCNDGQQLRSRRQNILWRDQPSVQEECVQRGCANAPTRISNYVSDRFFNGCQRGFTTPFINEPTDRK